MTNHRGPLQTVFVGDTFTSEKWGVLAVVKYEGTAKVTVQFEDGNQVLTSVGAIRLGIVKNPYKPSINGVGFLGNAHRTYPGNTLRTTPEYKAWAGMLKRCYDEGHFSKYTAYKGCSVAPEWHDFSIFAEWYKSQMGYGNDWHLDKDLKQKGNKVYSSLACALVPRDLNNILGNRAALRGDYPIGVHMQKQNGTYIAQMNVNGVNTYIGSYRTPEDAFAVYKREKEQYVKHMAERYKGIVPEAIYNSLMNFTVNITD